MSNSRQAVVGVIDLAMSGWTAGGVVSRTMALSLQAAGAEAVFITPHPESAPKGVRTYRPPKPHYLPGEWTLRKLTGWRKLSMTAREVRAAGVDVILPDVEGLGSLGSKAVGWIPDFQHHHLKDLYSDDQRALLDRAHRGLAERSRRMLFSSEDCRRDFTTFFPDLAGKARVASFPSLLVFETPLGELAPVGEKYHLPERFLLVINQFWRHKNHRVVPEALAILRQRGITVPVVMAGMPADYRDRQNDALSETLQAAARGGVWSDCVVLGKVPREDLMALLRTAAAIIQPSRFEGWNTTLQDAKAIGCPVIVSDLPVHREQCPGALGFFPPDNAEALADVIAAHWSSLPARPNLAQESAALERESAFARSYGQRLLEICSEAS